MTTDNEIVDVPKTGTQAADETQPFLCLDCASPDLFAAFYRSPKDNNTLQKIERQVFYDNNAFVILQCRGCGSTFLHPRYFAESFAVYSDPRYFTGYFPNNIHRGG